MIHLLVAGLNHKTAPVEVREKLAFNGPRLEEGIRKLSALPDVVEAVVLSTCNRVEMYTAVHEPSKARAEILDFISEFHGIERGKLDGAIYFHEGRDAVRHAFRVSSSLDSMIVGEAQILGQLKDAFEFALGQKTTGVMLNKLMKKAISVAKRVRTETRIAENAVNISSAAVDLAHKIFTDLTGKRVLLLGAGDMAELAARHLKAAGVTDIIVANRTYSTGCKLAEDMGGRPCKFESFPDEMLEADIVICSTGAPEYVVTKPQVHVVMKARKQRPIFMMDISVPRNIEPAVNELDNVFLYDVDDLQGVANAGLEERMKEAERGEAIVAEEIDGFIRWQSSLDAVPTIVALRDKAEEIKQQELERFMSRIQCMEERDRKLIEQLASNIVNKLIHPPTAALKTDIEDKDEMIAMIKRLYGLSGE